MTVQYLINLFDDRSVRADMINESYHRVIHNLRTMLEYGCAKGGLILKPYVTQTGISVEFIQADAFFPIDFDSSNRMTKCVFASQIRKGNKIYTKLEMHEMSGGFLKISNRAFVSTNDFSLGSEISVASVPEWSELSAAASFSGVDRSYILSQRTTRYSLFLQEFLAIFLICSLYQQISSPSI